MSLTYDPDGHQAPRPSEGLKLLDAARMLMPQLVAWRNHLHRHPELSFQERKTAQYLHEQLRAMAPVEVVTGIGDTYGLAARIGFGSGPHVAIRADMDALPLVETMDHQIRSEHDGVMHACGHDGHMAMALGAVHLISQLWQDWQLVGRVTVLFQPAEETPDASGKTGAPYIVESGILDDVDAIVALHMDPERPTGSIRLHDGACMASVDNFRMTLYGQGGHAGYPHQALDPLFLMVPVLQAIHGITARRVSPLVPAVISVCRVQGGTTNNVIPSEVTLEGTLRSYDAIVREHMIQELERAARLCENLGGRFQLDVARCEPATLNHPEVNRVVAQAFEDLTGSTPVRSGPFGMGGEDFGFMTQKVPGSLVFLGCGKPGEPPVSLHAPEFELDPEALAVGTALLTETVRRILKSQGLKRGGI